MSPLEHVRETQMKARIQGIAAQMKKFNLFLGVSLGLLILYHTDNLARLCKRQTYLQLKAKKL